MAMRARWRIARVSAAALVTSTSALALQQPDATTIPVVNPSVTTCSDNNVQVCLDAEEGSATIGAQSAAAVTPETYKPLCTLTFKVLARGAGYMNTFGWYNVDPNGKPPASDLHSFLECTDGVGTTKPLSIKTSGYYKGGEIGFFMATPEGASGNCPQFAATGGPISGTVGQIYYSERKYNPDNTGANSWVHLITYNSVTHPNSFYFAWEDLLSGGDNDFDDLLTRVEGIQCSGGGEPCPVPGQQGKCANGLKQCQNGQLACVQSNQPTPEKCNALDDDCNGQTDEGDLCPADQVCYKGSCVPKCGTAEFQCLGTAVCKDGVCIDPLCANVTCNAGEVCVAGKCQGACDGVSCPFGQSCVEGTCVDPCAGITCDSDFVCVAGVCKVGCGCEGCPSGQQCDSTTNQCADTGCSPNPCSAGTHCVAGNCVDDCAGAVCPAGQSCSAGKCVSGAADAGADGAAGSGSGGISFGGSGGSGANSGGSGAKDGGMGTGNTAALPGTIPAEDSACGCRAVGRPVKSLFAWVAALGALAFARRRRSGRPA